MDKKKIIKILNEDRESELGAISQYMLHHYRGEGLGDPFVVKTFKKTAIDEMKHAEALAERIHDLGGVPSNRRAPMKMGGNPKKMVRDDLKAELGAIRTYKRHIEICKKERDAASRRLLKKTLSDEERHAAAWRAILKTKI